MKNNLFSYATSELSQDAFISWLMSFAMPEAKPNSGLRKCAVAFIKEFVPELLAVDDENIIVNSIEQQHKKIDVLLTVNGKYKIIIEDKTNTDDHDNQLERYFNELVKEGIPESNIRGVYFKTGFTCVRQLKSLAKGPRKC